MNAGGDSHCPKCGIEYRPRGSKSKDFPGCTGRGRTPARCAKCEQWTDEEIGIVADTMDWPIAQVRQMLDRPGQSVKHARLKVEHGWVRKIEPWTGEENATIRSAVGVLTQKELADRFPSRSFESVVQQCVRLGVQLGTKKDMRAIGSRTLVAKTCTKCGLTRSGAYFYFNKGSNEYDSWCRICKNALARERMSDDQYRERYYQEVSAYGLAAQRVTVERAENHRKPYTDAEHEVLSDPTRTNLDKALTLRRTFNSVNSAIRRNGYKSFSTGLDPDREVWLIDIPGAVRGSAGALHPISNAHAWQWDD